MRWQLSSTKDNNSSKVLKLPFKIWKLNTNVWPVVHIFSICRHVKNWIVFVNETDNIIYYFKYYSWYQINYLNQKCYKGLTKINNKRTNEQNFTLKIINKEYVLQVFRIFLKLKKCTFTAQANCKLYVFHSYIKYIFSPKTVNIYWTNSWQIHTAPCKIFLNCDFFKVVLSS